MDRREFLKLIGSGTVGVILSQTPIGRLIPLVKAKSVPLPSEEERYITSACLLCSAGCGIRVRVYNGIAKSVTGNPYHPISRGGLCPKGLSAIQYLYHPNRIQTALKRVGKKGDNKWEPVEFDQAINEIVEKLLKIRAKSPEKVMFWNGRPYGLMDKLIERFMKVLGAPRYYREKDWFSIWSLTTKLTQGVTLSPIFDIKNSDYVLSVGANLFDGYPDLVGIGRQYAKFREGVKGKRGKLIHVEPHLSITAIKADRWIQIKPSSYFYFVLGILYVLIKENMIANEFVKSFTSNSKEFREFVMKNGKLNIVESKTGVPSGTLYLIARELYEANNPLVISGFMSLRDENALRVSLLVHSLNALLGNFEKDGGIKFSRKIPYKKFSEPKLDSIAKRFKDLEFIENPDFDNPPEALFIYYTNPVYKYPDTETITSFLLKTPLVVSFSPYMDETSLFADYILPDHTFLERWQDAPSLPFYEELALAIARPVVKPVFNTRHTGDVILTIAKKLDTNAKGNFPWKNFKEFMFDGLEGLYESRMGSYFSDEFEVSQLMIMEESGFWLPPYKSTADFKKKIIERGGWCEPSYHKNEWKRIFKNKSTKFIFPNKKLLAISERKGNKENGLYLYPFLPLSSSFGTDTVVPFVNEVLGFRVNTIYDSWCEISSKLAEKMGVKDGDVVEIEGPNGTAKVKVKIIEGTSDEIVALPLGFGHEAFGKYAKGVGINPLKLVPLKFNKETGTMVFEGFRVKIRRLKS